MYCLLVVIGISLVGCGGQRNGLSEREVEDALQRIFSQGEAHRMYEEETDTGSTSTMKPTPIPGSLDVTEIRFSDGRDKILVSADYESEKDSMALECILDRDEFGVYRGSMYLPGDLWVFIEIEEP